MPSFTVENYLKAIYSIAQETQTSSVSMGLLADSLGISAGTVTTMVKSFQDKGFLTYTPRVGVKLTPRGKKMALHVLRRHRLVELFLVQFLEMDWTEVHEEAERLEHAVSDKVVDRMEKLLGYPEYDPHGDPIPLADGRFKKRSLIRLDKCQPTEKATVARILDQEPDFLRYVEENQLSPGVAITILAAEPTAGTITLETDQQKIVIGLTAAAKIDVEKVS